MVPGPNGESNVVSAKRWLVQLGFGTRMDMRAEGEEIQMPVELFVHEQKKQDYVRKLVIDLEKADVNMPESANGTLADNKRHGGRTGETPDPKERPHPRTEGDI